MAKAQKGEHRSVGTEFIKGKSGNPRGRPRKVSKAIKEIDADAQQRVYLMLWRAIATGSVKQAEEYLEQMRKEGDERCGAVLEIAIKNLKSDRDWSVLQDILNRLFGTPKQSADVQVNGDLEFKFKFGDE